MGNDNPTSVTGEFSGSITTGCHYDPYTGNAKRVIEDIVVPGSIGAYPLKWTRILNTRSGWTNSYNWDLWFRAPQPPHGGEEQYEGPVGGVSYPDGRHIDLWDQGEQFLYDAEGPRGMFNKIMDRGGGYYDLVLGDGGRVVFYMPPANITTTGWAFAQAIVDPYGQITTLDRDANGKLIRVTEPGGRYLQINYNGTPPYDVGSVQAFDGRGNLIETVSYGYTQVWVNSFYHYNLTQVYYDDGTQAVYTYELSNLHNSPNPGYSATPDVVHSCDDVRYAGPMKQIEYEYVQWGEAAPGYVAWGQIKSERNFNTHQIVSQVSHPASSYDATINQRTETRGDGATRLFSYGLPGDVDHYTDFKNQTTWLYPFTDARGNTTMIEYEPALRAVKKLTHPDNSTIESTFSDPYNPYYISGRKDERNNWTYYDRDSNNPDPNKRGLLLQTRYPDGSFEQFSYNQFGQVLTHRLTSGGAESFTYDYRGLKTSSTDPFGNVTHYNYFWNDRLQNVVDPYGNATWYDYNQRGQITRVTHQDASYIENGYNPDGTLAWTSDELRHYTSYTYDEYKRVLTVTNPMGQTTTNWYGLDASWQNPLLHTTNNPKYTLSPMNKNVVYDYDANFRKFVQVAAMGTADEAWTWFGYDEVGNLSWTRDPRNNTTSFGYDARNRRTSVTNALNQTTWCGYDGTNNKAWETRADGTSRSWSYDSMNRLVDHYGFAGERVVHYGRNTEHTWEWITDAKNATYAINYDALHRKVFEHYPPDATRADPGEAFWYDAVGNLIQYKNPADQLRHFSYDSRHRERDSWWDSNGPWIHRDYDAASRMTSITTNGGETTVSLGYDDANRKLWEDQTLSGYPTRRVGTDRDADGNRANLYIPSYFGVNYEYNQRSQLAHIRDGNGAPFYDFSYDASGNETQRQCRYFYPNVANYQYDPLNRVAMAEQGANGWIFARSWYQYDNLSREVATWREEDNGMGGSRGERYWYDVTDQLTNVRYNADQVWTGSPANWNRAMDYNYTSDRLNRASTVENGSVSGYQANALNQYASVNGQGIGYDDNFNVTSYNGVSFSYNAQNQLTGGSMQATYDGLGRCVRRTTGSGTRLYTYDDWNPIFEWDQWGNWLGWNAYGAHPDELLIRWDAVHGPMIYKQDQHGNVVALLDSGGNIVERYSYDAFGKPKVTGFWDDNDRGGSWYGNRFMFTGREWIAELGIYDYRNRYYQPQLGRFLQTDPLGFAAGDMNLFRYCGDDPVDRSDPTGLVEQDTNSAIWNRMRFFDSSSTSQSSLYEMNKFQEIQGIINHLIAEIADAKKIEERSGSKVSWEFTGNWSEPYGNHVTGEKLTANDKPAAGRTDPGFDVRDKDGGVGTQLKIDWKIRRSVASDPQVALMEVRDHVAGLVRWGIAMQKHTNSGEAGQTASSVRNFLDSSKRIGGVPLSRYHNEVSTQKLYYDRGRHNYEFDPNAD
jgi:RHS repeat-associated protein